MRPAMIKYLEYCGVVFNWYMKRNRLISQMVHF